MRNERDAKDNKVSSVQVAKTGYHLEKAFQKRKKWIESRKNERTMS